MPDPRPPLAELAREIDRTNEAMHRLLMERGEIIGRLIKAKHTTESGSAFRPAREADMMRRLVERHRGILPLDTAESIWRVIIATFTYVQAPFRVHADFSAMEPLGAVSGGRRSRPTRRRKSSRGCRSSSARTIRPACRCSRLPGLIRMPSSVTWRCGAFGWPVGVLGPPRHWQVSRRPWWCRT